MESLAAPRAALAAALLAMVLVAVAPPLAADTLLVANKSDATLSLIDLVSGEVVVTLPTGAGPHEVAVSPDGLQAVVANYGTGAAPGSTLTLVDVAGAQVLATIDLGSYTRPHGLAWPATDTLLVTCEGAQALVVVDPTARKVVKAVATGQEVSHMVAVAPDGARAYVANIGSGTITAIDLAAGKKLGDVATGAGAEGIAVSADGRVWVTNRAADTVSVVDGKSLEVVRTIALGAFPIRAEASPDGRWVLVSNAQSGSVAAIDVETGEVAKTIDLDVPAKDPAGRLLQLGDGGPVPIGIEIAPNSKLAWVANANADVVSVLDLESWTVVGGLTAGREPDGMAYSPHDVRRAVLGD